MVNSALEWSVPMLLLICGASLVIAARINFTSAKWGYGLCLLGVGYWLMLFRTDAFSIYKPIFEDAFIIAGVAACCHAFYERFDLKVSYKFTYITATAAVILASLSLIFYKNVRLESLAIMVSVALLLADCIWRIRNIKLRHSDFVLCLVFCIVIAAMLAQVVAYIFVHDLPPIVGLWSESIWGVLLQYTALFSAVMLVIAVLLAANLDLMSRRNDKEMADQHVYAFQSDANGSAGANVDLLRPNGLKQRRVCSLEDILTDDGLRIQIAITLTRISQSKRFSSSPRQKEFLNYIVEETLMKRADRIKEYTIALDVYGRKVDNDLMGDSVVRTAANRLRLNLDAYFKEEGQWDPVHITVPKGGYTPQFWL